jgi:hypothetical protein
MTCGVGSLEKVQVNSMDDSESLQEKNPATKTHAAVLTMLEEVRSYEGRFGPYDVIEENASQEIPELDYTSHEWEQPHESITHDRWNLAKLFHLGLERKDSSDSLTPTASSSEIEGQGLSSKLKNLLPWTQHKGRMDEQGLLTQEEEEISSFRHRDHPVNVFRLRFDDHGKLVMLDRRTPKPKPQWNINKATFLNLFRKKDREASSPSSEGEPASRFAKITNKLSFLISLKNIAKLKKIIPFIRKENKER